MSGEDVERLDMRDGEDGSTHHPGETQQRVEEDQTANEKQIQMIARMFLNFRQYAHNL